MAKQRSPIARDIQRRVRLLYVLFLLAGIVIIGKILLIQYGPEGDELRDKAKKITFERVASQAERGDILASDGRILATSIPMYEIRMDFAAAGLTDTLFDNNVDALAGELAAFFKDKPKAAYKTMLVNARAARKSNRYKLISPRRIDYLEEKTVSSFPILCKGPNKGGYIKIQKNKREVPHGTLARRTIGSSTEYLADDSTIRKVRYGIEGAYDSVLRGTDGSTLMQRISGNFKVPVPDPMNVEPVNGMDVVTTIDVDLQDVAEKALREQLDRGNADWGTVILMEVATGEIHAMSNITRTAPGVFKEDFNYAIGRRMEPGSTFKLASLITLLEDGGMSLDHMINCEGGKAKVGIRVVTDTHAEGTIPLRRVFEVSSNVGFAKAVHQTYASNPGRFVDFVRGMGLGEPLGIDMGGEREPLIKHPGEKGSAWDGMSLVMMSYGYALEITPMHTLALYNAVANGGVMVRPHIVREVRNYGQTVYEYPVDTINPAICSPRTIGLVRECLAGVVDEGTGRILKNPYYVVAAKTGTAQMAFQNGGYMDRNGGRNYLATMVGYFPADNPKYSCIVAIKTYNGPGNRNTYYGASLSGPVFKAIADRVYAVNSSWHDRIHDNGRHMAATTGEIKAGRSDQLKTVSERLHMGLPLEGGMEQWAYIRRDTTDKKNVNYICREEPAGYAGEEMADAVPSVIGMGLKDALWLLESKGFDVAFTGAGRVLSQSLDPGTQAVPGQTIELKLGTKRLK